MGNKLSIDARHIKLEFTGNQEDIRRGYDMTRELLIMHFHEQLARAEVERERDEVDTRRAQRETQSQWAPPAPHETLHISIALCSDFYNKVCVLERESYERSVFGRLLRFDHLQRLYIRSDQKEIFSKHFKIGKVLWRELTPEGRDAVRSE